MGTRRKRTVLKPKVELAMYGVMFLMGLLATGIKNTPNGLMALVVMLVVASGNLYVLSKYGRGME